MRALAEFVMRGRTQAAIAAALGGFLPLVSAAVVALVVMRRGLSDGFIVFLWALLPAVLLVVFYGTGDSSLFVLSLAPVVTLIVTMLAAVVLRITASWQKAVVVSVLCGVLAALSLQLFLAAHLDAVVQSVSEVFLEISQERTRQGIGDVPLSSPDKFFIVGALAYSCTLNALLCLVLARWWQASLYNPGGFQAEFHQLRLGHLQALLLLGPVIYCLLVNNYSGSWGYLAALPFLFSGIALVHWLVKQRHFGGIWLVIFYIALIFSQPVVLLTVGIALLDSFFDFRGRWRSIGSGSA